MKNRIFLISLVIVLALSVSLVGCATEYGSELAKHTLAIASTDGGDSSCVPSIDCTCDEGTENGGGLSVPQECICAGGTDVSIEATPDPGYRFIGWTGDVDTIADVNDATTTITMNDDYSIRASFAKQCDLTISSTAGGVVATPGEGTFTYDDGEAVNLVANAEEGYHFVNWTGDVDTVDDVNAATTTITANSNYSIIGNFAVDLYFQTDAYLALNGPATLPPVERNPCLILGIMTNILVDSVRVDLPDGGSVIIPAYTDVYTPDVDWTTLFRFSTCVSGMPLAGGEYIFTGLDVAGEPIPGASDTDIWVGVEPPNPMANVRAEVVEDGISVSWDESPIIPGSFEPAGKPQLGNYQLTIYKIDTGEDVYGAGSICASPYLIPRDKAGFTGGDHGLSLSEMEDGAYCLFARVHSMAPEGSSGKGCEYNNGDSSEDIIFTIVDGKVTGLFY